MDSDIRFDSNSKEVKSAVNIIIKKQKFSTALLQTYLGKSHTYVSALADWLEEIGVIGPENGQKPRAVLINNMDEFFEKTSGSHKKEKTKESSILQNTTTRVTTKKSTTSGHGWIVVLVVFVLIGLWVAGNNIKHDTGKDQSGEGQQEESIPNYAGQDAKIAYENLNLRGYSVKFVFDRNNNGGFSDEQFQSFVLHDSFESEYYNEMPFVVVSQMAYGKNVTLTIEYKSSVEEKNSQQNRENQLENKLSIVSAMSACEIYGKRNYSDFKLHSIAGRIAEYAVDNDTWLLKYTADANGRKNLNMECYVTGTTNNPVVKDFKLY